MTPREQFIAWLNDARSTELAMIPVLKNHANDARDYPEIYERDMQHLEETQHQAERLETMIKSLGGSVSTVKTMIGKITGAGHSISTEIFPDELIKNFLADYAAEHFEIASYTSLIATAELIGEYQCVPVLQEILEEEIRMARWLEDYIPIATAESLKVTTGGEEDGEYSNGSSRRKKKSVLKRVTKPSVLVTLASLGAIGAGAALLMRSSQNKNLGGRSNRSLQSGTGFDRGAIRGSDDVEQTDVVVTETLIIVEEPELTIPRTSDGDNRS